MSHGPASVAVTAFLVAILASAEDAFKFITPVLGLSLFVGIVVHSLRLWSGAGSMSTAEATAT